MRRIILATILAFVLPVAAGSESPQIQTKKLTETHFEMTVTLPDITDPTIAQQAMMPAAAKVCGERPLRLGKYKFESIAPLAGTGSTGSPSLKLVQEVHCEDAAVTSDPSAASSPAPREAVTQTDEVLINTRTLEYLAAKDRGDFDVAHAMFSETMRDMMTEDAWRAPRAAFNAAAGSEPQRNVIRVTWYDDPPAAPAPGRYAAADYSASYANSSFYCGYVAWLLQPDGTYQIVREEEGLMKKGEALLVPPGDMAAVRAQLGCRD